MRFTKVEVYELAGGAMSPVVVEVEVGAETTVADILAQVKARFPRVTENTWRHLMVLVGTRVATPQTRVSEGDVVKVIPPLDGG